MKKFILFTLALVGSIGVWGETADALQARINSAEENSTIYLTENITGGKTINITKDLTVDLGSYSIEVAAPSTGCYFFNISGSSTKTVTVKFTGVKGSAKLIGQGSKTPTASSRGNGYWGLICPSDYSCVTIENISFANKRNNPCVKAYSTNETTGLPIECNISNCNFTSSYSSDNNYYGGGITSDGSNTIVTISNCTAAIANGFDLFSSALVASNDGTLIINNGTYESKIACVAINISGGDITIKNGTFICSSKTAPVTGSTNNYVGAIFCYVNRTGKEGTITVQNGSFEGNLYCAKGQGKSANLKIEGGSFSTNGVYTSTSGSAGSTTTISNYVQGDTEFVQDENGKYIAAPKAAPSGVYSRTVTSGSWGTICLPNDVEKGNITGADFFMINGKQTTGGQTQIVLDQVESLEKGKPYFFQATGTTLSCTVTASSEIVSAQNINGLYGTLLGINWDATNSTHASETDVTLSNASALLLSSGELKSSIAGSALAPNRAYVVLADVPEYNPSAPVSGRRMVMSVDGKGAPNAMDEVEVEAMQTQKVIVDGKLYIRRGNQWFDAQGALVK